MENKEAYILSIQVCYEFQALQSVFLLLILFAEDKLNTMTIFVLNVV